MFSNTDLNNYYKIEEDAVDDGLSAFVLNTYTKTETDTQLTDYTPITYLQGKYMTTLSLTETSMNNYASISLLGGDFYDNAYLDNHFRLKQIYQN